MLCAPGPSTLMSVRRNCIVTMSKIIIRYNRDVPAICARCSIISCNSGLVVPNFISARTRTPRCYGHKLNVSGRLLP